MYTISNQTTKPFKVKLELNGVCTTMEVDTGVSVSTMGNLFRKGQILIFIGTVPVNIFSECHYPEQAHLAQCINLYILGREIQ